MALIEVFHVVASQLPINANDTTDIPVGSLGTLSSNGEVELASDADLVTTNGPFPIGIAGDSRSQGTTSYSAESGSASTRSPLSSLEGALVVGAYGDSQRYTQNRVADNYNEVLASGKMTVYHSGGEFWTDQYEIVRDDNSTATVFTPGKRVYASSVGTSGRKGRFSDDVVAGHEAGIVLTSPTGYPSGVPGTGVNAVGFQALPEGGNSLAWGTFLHVKLEI